MKARKKRYLKKLENMEIYVQECLKCKRKVKIIKVKRRFWKID